MNLFEVLIYIVEIIFLFLILSYYFLLVKKNRIPKGNEKFRHITVIIPARNESRYIKKCITSVMNAKFNGKKSIIVVDDASSDGTYKIAKSFPVQVFKMKKHSGK